MGKRKLLSVLLCCTALAACGGGGNIQENLAAANGGDSPPPAADPSDDFETGEYLANWGLGAVNPIPAWEAGITGQGVVVAVIDSGIDDAHADLDGNIHPDSNYTGDIGGQGTFIAGIIASEKEGNGTHGIAFESQILAIQSASTNAGIASAIDYAVAHEADVINISIDGGAPDATILTALQNAAQAGIIVIFNAGDADFSYDASVSLPPSAPTPKLLAMVATEALANGQFLIVGTMDKDREAHYDDFDRDPDNAPADPDWHDVSGTNIAGEIGAEYYVLAPGQEIFSTRAGGSDLYEFRGGSAYAAPVVAAAVALLKQSFPSLTADEIVTILTKTADDVVSYSGIDGSNNLPGADEINGHGIINIGAALSPIGTNSLAIKTQSGWIKTDLEDAGLVSGGVFGDGVGNGFASGAIFLDDFDRAYRTSFSNQIITANPFINFDSRFTNVRDYRQASIALSPDFHVSFAANYSVAGSPYEQNLPGLREDDTGLAENVNIRLTKGVGKSSAVSMSVGGSLAGVMSFGRPDTGFAHATNLSAGMSDPWISSGRSSHYGDGQRIGFIHNLNDTMTLSVGISSDLVATPNYENLSEHDPEASRKIIVSQLQGGKGRLGWKTLLGIVNEEGMVLDRKSVV